MSVEFFPADKQTPEHTLLQAQQELEDMELVAVVYIRKGEQHPRLTCSSMAPVDMNFLGMALQHHSLRYLKD